MAELGALEAMAVQGAQEAMAEMGAQEAMADGLRGPWRRSPRPGPYSRNPFYPPKNFPVEVRGYQEPSGARHTEQYMTRLQGQTNRTGHPTGTRSPPGLAGHDMTSGALTGSLNKRFHLHNKGAGG